MYKIIDKQNTGFFKGALFKDKTAVRNALVRFHSDDVENVDRMSLLDICEMGCWRVIKANNKQ